MSNPEFTEKHWRHLERLQEENERLKRKLSTIEGATRSALSAICSDRADYAGNYLRALFDENGNLKVR